MLLKKLLGLTLVTLFISHAAAKSDGQAMSRLNSAAKFQCPSFNTILWQNTNQICCLGLALSSSLPVILRDKKVIVQSTINASWPIIGNQDNSRDTTTPSQQTNANKSGATGTNLSFEEQGSHTSFSFRILPSLMLVVSLSMIMTFWYRKKLTLTILSIFLFMVILEIQIENIVSKQESQSSQLDLLRQLSSVTAKLEGNLKTNLSLLAGFAAYISASPELTQTDFDNYAREVLKQEPMLINFASAKDLVVNFIYPLAGNESVMGLKYLENDAQKDMVMQVVNTEKMLVAGPVNLIQGGTAFIGRAPIYTGDGTNRRLWGIISAPLDAQALYRNSEVSKLALDVNLAIRRYGSDKQEGQVFYGDGTIFELPNRVETFVNAGAGLWHLAVTAKNEDGVLSTTIAISRTILAFVAILLCAFARIRFRQESEKRKLEDAVLSNQQLLENVGSVAKIGGWKIDRHYQFLEWSDQASLLLRRKDYLAPQKLSDLEICFTKDDSDYWKQQVKLAFINANSFDIELKLKALNDEVIWLRIIGHIYSEDNHQFVMGTIQDVTDKVESARLIERQATYDSLTGLPNRVLFNDRLAKATQNAQRNENEVAVLFIDLDRFKPVNDNHGHQTGDKLLIKAAQRIQPCVRKSDTVARLSGDEFGVILVNIKRYSDALKVIEKIYEKMQQTYNIDGIRLHCSASIGVSFYPNDGDNAELLLRKADQAMYEVKSSGRNGWQYYTSQMQQKSEHRHRLLNELIMAVKEDQLVTYYQPIIDLKTNEITKCESLARWINRNGKFISPAEFIPLAEESGLINQIDLIMLKNASSAVQAFDHLHPPVSLSINVSPRLFHAKDKALENWITCVEEYSKFIDITVEITERLIIDDAETALKVLNQLKSCDVKLAFDDFGTGYSSLSYLIKFPVDIIKIDRSFVDAIGSDTSAETLIQTILIMANKLELKVVAEGIETEEQLAFLKQHHCDFGQGYYLGKPMSESDFKQRLSEKSNARSVST